MDTNQIKKLFIQPNEQLVAILGYSFAQSFFTRGGIKSGFAVLSDQRLYFRGKCLLRTGKRFSTIHEQRTVDVRNVTGTGFVYINPIWLRVCAIILWVFGGIMTIGMLIYYVSPLGLLIGLGTALLGVVFEAIYRACKRTVFEVAFAGGGIGIDASTITQQEADFFQKNLKLVGDNLRSQERMYGKATSEASELERYAALLEKGLISREEFEEQKRNLLHY